jgi:aminoglycoside phosphotransferase family enzyme
MPWWRRRLADGFVRECHGDLHLGNLVQLPEGPTAFDCIEFDPALRWIDTMNDLAFLTMDLQVRGRRDLAFALLDGYLSHSGDWDGWPGCATSRCTGPWCGPWWPGCGKGRAVVRRR